MIRDLKDKEMEQASGGFDAGEFIGLTNGHRVNLEASGYVLGLVAATEQEDSLSNLVGMALPENPPRLEATPVVIPNASEIENLSLPTCHDRRGRYAICQTDGMNERWESYRPQQPSFRSRFINR